MTADPIGCQDECRRYVADEQEAEAQGWSRLQITGRWRCPQCAHALAAINSPSPVAQVEQP